MENTASSVRLQKLLAHVIESHTMPMLDTEGLVALGSYGAVNSGGVLQEVQILMQPLQLPRNLNKSVATWLLIHGYCWSDRVFRCPVIDEANVLIAGWEHKVERTVPEPLHGEHYGVCSGGEGPLSQLGHNLITNSNDTQSFANVEPVLEAFAEKCRHLNPIRIWCDIQLSTKALRVAVYAIVFDLVRVALRGHADRS
jgi:hypothetical protein